MHFDVSVANSPSRVIRCKWKWNRFILILFSIWVHIQKDFFFLNVEGELCPKSLCLQLGEKTFNCVYKGANPSSSSFGKQREVHCQRVDGVQVLCLRFPEKISSHWYHHEERGVRKNQEIERKAATKNNP